MFTYAAPLVCPACRSGLPPRPEFAFGPAADADRSLTCPQCAVPLDHPVAARLVNTLREADGLVLDLRDLVVPLPSAAPVHPARPAHADPPLRPYPAPAAPRPVPGSWEPAPAGLRASSVPRILLGLGALCLLVAAVAFLAVAWAWLGVAGRTSVLVGLTGLSAGLGLLAGRRRLRAAAEALVSVSLGLVLLDVAGAASSGWLGDPSGADLAVVSGLAIALAAGLLVAADRRLGAPQVALALGLLVAGLGVVVLADAAPGAAALVLVGLVAPAPAARALDLARAPVALLGAAAVAWLVLVALAADELVDLPSLTVGALWSGPGWALAVAGLALLAPLLLTRHRVVVVLSASATAVVLTALACLPALDDGDTRVGLAGLLAAAAWTGVAHLAGARRPLVALVALAPAGLALATPAVLGLVLLQQAADAALAPTPSLRLPATGTTSSPWLLVPTVLVLLALAARIPHAGAVVPPARAAWCGAVATALAVVATVALHPVPLAVVVVLLALLATAVVVEAVRHADVEGTLRTTTAGVVLGSGLLVAQPSPGLLCLLGALALALSLLVLARGRFAHADLLGGVVLAPSAALLVWTTLDLLGLDASWRAVPVLVVVGALALLRARVEVEVPAAFAAVLAVATAVLSAADPAATLALHLTVSGALVGTSAIVHPHRRPLSNGAGVLLLLALWVRLGDSGVTTPEAYTLPAAALLLAAGAHRVLTDRHSASTPTLLPGLTTATLPSLVVVLAGDPVSVRALLLGLACLGLVLLGGRLRWSGPLLVGAVVGGVLVLAELAPYAATLPQWLVLGSAGLLLTAVGVTWERRVVDVRRASSALGRLR